jgi:hypothetical protein
MRIVATPILGGLHHRYGFSKGSDHTDPCRQRCGMSRLDFLRRTGPVTLMARLE